MRIIFLHPHFTSAGGAGRAVLETGSRLAARGYRVHCVCIRADRRFVDGYTGIEFHQTGGPLSSSLWFWLRFTASCKKINDVVNRIVSEAAAEPCVLYPQVFPANWWAADVLIRRPSLACVWYCQEPSAFIHSRAWMNALPWPKNWIASLLNPILKKMDLKRARRFTNVLVNSDFSKRYAQSIYGYDHDQCKTVYLGVDPGRFNAASSPENRQPWVIVIAKLTRFKNVDRIIEAIRLLVADGHMSVHLHIVGTGDAEESLQQLVDQHQLRQRVTFHGNALDRELLNLLKNSMALCLASVDEPFGLVAIEAMACGTPVVAVDSGGPKEIVGDSGAGILVPTGSPAEFASAIKTILDLNVEFSTISNAAIRRAADFGWERTVDRLESVFEDFADRPPHLCPDPRELES